MTLRRVEFCGGIGAGKSTCAALVVHRWQLPLVAERFEDIPYWRLFYQHPAAFTLEKDLSFLLSHADTMRSAPGPCVCDFAMVQTVAYSAITADAEDMRAVAAVYERLTARVGHPCTIVRLRCHPEVQLRRIAERGRAPEAGITRNYLERLDAAIEAELARIPADVPRIVFDTTVAPPAALLDHPDLVAFFRRTLRLTPPSS